MIILYNTISFLFILGIISLLFTIIGNKNTQYIYWTFGRAGLLITGAIGTIIHELSHLIMCVLFKHTIVEFSLFRPIKSKNDNIMGYVNHTCNLKSFYQRLGNFFIGIAPLIGGTIVIIISYKFLLPNDFNKVMYIINNSIKNIFLLNSNVKESINITEIFNYINELKIIIGTIIFNIKPSMYSINLNYFIFVFITYSVATHMSLSKEDFNNSLSGLIFLIIIFSILNISSYIFNIPTFLTLINIELIISIFMFIGLIFSFLTLIISFLLSFIFRKR